jgi:hypothetical protein
MKSSSTSRRRPAFKISLARAARLHRLVVLLAAEPRPRAEVLGELRIGFRTFYRDLEFLKRHGIKIQRRTKHYTLPMSAEAAELRLPFPDPQLSFAEMAELAREPGKAGARLAAILARVVQHPARSRRPRPQSGPTRPLAAPPS